MTGEIRIISEISPGELIDKLTILEIKLAKISDPKKLRNIRVEYQSLSQVLVEQVTKSGELDRLTEELKSTNQTLWKIEDDIRLCEKNQCFDDGFIALARSVYRTNDERARLKKAIDLHLGARFHEEKSYGG